MLHAFAFQGLNYKEWTDSVSRYPRIVYTPYCT